MSRLILSSILSSEHVFHLCHGLEHVTDSIRGNFFVATRTLLGLLKELFGTVAMHSDRTIFAPEIVQNEQLAQIAIMKRVGVEYLFDILTEFE